MNAYEPLSLHDGLIASKLVPPPRDSRAISRGDFISKVLEELPRSRVIRIVAPAGSGKSSLMTELRHGFDQQNIPACWIGLDAEDNDPATFALYFISALDAIEPGFARDELTALGANPVRDFDSLFTRLRKRLSTRTSPGAIFLDDFQHLTDPRILRFFNRLLVHLPHDLSLIIASRHRQPLDLAKLLVAGRVTEIGQEDLNFDQAETELFLRRYHQLHLSGTDLRSLFESTEGWPTGVQLAALALRRHRGPASELIRTFSGRDRDLTSYLVESVIRAQPENVRAFLLRTSPLRRMCAELCEATTQQDDARSMLDYIGQANLFLIALDGEGQWYRYHHLFAEFLQNQFKTTDPAEYRDVCFRAAKWCEANGQPTEAIRYALDAAHFELAADLIARHAMRASLFRGDHYTVRDWMRILPAAFHTRRPEILLSHAWSCAFSRDTTHAMEISQQAIDALSVEDPIPWGLSEPERDRWLQWAFTVQAATKACSDDIDDCVTRATDLFSKVSQSDPFLIATLSNCLSYGYFALRKFERSREYALLAHEHGHRADAAYLSGWGDFLHGLIDVESGHLQAAISLGQRVKRDSRGLGLGQKGYVAGLSALLDAEIAVQRCDFDRASAHIDVGRAFKEIFGPVEPQLVALRCEARLHAFQNRLDLAIQVLEEGQDAALREQHRRLYLSLAMEEASLKLTAGDITGAAATARRTRLLDPDGVDDVLIQAQRNLVRLMDARFKLAYGDAKSAARILTSLQQARGAEIAGAFFLSVTTHRAIALWELGQKSDAVRQLDRALVDAAPEFHAYPIISAGRSLLPLMDYLSERRTEAPTHALEPLLALQGWLTSTLRGESGAQRSRRDAEATSTTPAVEPLTPREVDLVRLLHSGLSNQKIATALLLTVPTVKWHLHNVYGKLGVGTRGAAVATAVQMGLI